MDRLDVMRLFVRIVERSSFSAATRDLRVPRASATRAIQELESNLQTRLLERTTRSVRPTVDGERYYRDCIRLLGDIEEVEGQFRETAFKGPVRVDLQGTLARYFVLPALAEFLETHPEIALHLSETDRMVDLVGEGIDCVLRAGDLPDSSLVGRQVAASRQATLASPAYLRRYGNPESLNALKSHRMVAYTASSTGHPYPLEFSADGETHEMVLAYDVQVRGAEIYTAAGLAGLGLIQVPRYRVLDQIASGVLVPILERFDPKPMPVWVLYPQGRNLPSRVRAFVDWLCGTFEKLQMDGRI